MPDVRVTDEHEPARYVLEVDGERIGLLTYRLQDGQIALTHAEVHPASGGQGLGSRLAAYALDDARRRGLSVLPLCPFMSDYIRQNPEYTDLVPDGVRSRFGL